MEREDEQKELNGITSLSDKAISKCWLPCDFIANRMDVDARVSIRNAG